MVNAFPIDTATTARARRRAMVQDFIAVVLACVEMFDLDYD
jgi:hypothetical protein